MKRIFLLLLISLFIGQPSWAARAEIEVIARDPYLSALAVDADTGKLLFEENGDARAYPASVTKLMVLLILLERIEQGTIALDEMVQITEEAARMGGSQVYLDPKEQFPVEDLLYALIIQSANDAAVALAIHVAGSKEGFVALMNEKAKALGMKNTRFHSVHGLPPSKGQEPDQSTAVDLAILGRELTKKPEVFKYTGAREREFRNGEFIMRTHNHLLADVEGADGFKTGYFTAAGFSIVATAKRNGVRIIAVVLGSKDRKTRDAKATELLTRSFTEIPARLESKTQISKPASAPATQAQVASPLPDQNPPQAKAKKELSLLDHGWLMYFLGLGTGLLFFLLIALFKSKNRQKKHHHRLS